MSTDVSRITSVNADIIDQLMSLSSDFDILLVAHSVSSSKLSFRQGSADDVSKKLTNLKYQVNLKL